MRLRSKIAIVTGGSSGFGRTTAIRFAEEVAKVVVADLDEETFNHRLSQLALTCSAGSLTSASRNQSRLLETGQRKR